MASTEQPLKKRKLYDSLPAESPALLQHHHGPASLPPSPDDILRKRRNREEIRSLYDCYKRIRFCVSQKDSRLMADFERAYLSLITASRGCTSVQRIVAELIPRYASFCPTALEAAAKVAINMHNWSVAIIMRGEDVDGIAYQTAKTCIFGLVDICSTASSEAPTSAVIRGICSAVFVNVLSFFVSTFEGKDIYQIGYLEIEKLKEPMELFSELKQERKDDHKPALSKLFRFRALSLLKIFFSCPKNLLAACFELFGSSGTDGGVHSKGHYFLSQVTSHLNASEIPRALGKTSDGTTLFADSINSTTENEGFSAENLASDGSKISKKSTQPPKSCFMEMVIDKEPSLRLWMFLRYKKLCKTFTCEVASEVSSLLEVVFGSLSELVQDPALGEDSDEDSFDHSKYINRQYLMHKISSRQDSSADLTCGERSSRIYDASASNALYVKTDEIDKSSDQTMTPCLSMVPCETGNQLVNETFTNESEGLILKRNSETIENEDSFLGKSSMLKDSKNNLHLFAGSKKSLEKYTDSEKESHGTKIGRNLPPDNEVSLPSMITSGGVAPNVLPSPQRNSAIEHRVCSSSQIIWYSDGDPSAMDVFSASRQLWVGCVGRDASEIVVRLQFEDFGPLENFLFFPTKDFALIEYRNIMDAVRAREYMGDSTPWGSRLRVKFIDEGLGSRGGINGLAVGDSCNVYIGKVLSQHAKDEILQELTMVGFRGPHMVSELSSESALLLEFTTAEEAVLAMAHIRKWRKDPEYHGLADKSITLNACTKDKFSPCCQLLVRHIDMSATDEELIHAFSGFGELTGWKFIRQSGCCLINFRSTEAAELARSHLDGARFGSTPIRVEVRTNNLSGIGSSILSPPASFIQGSSIDGYNTRLSQLSSLFATLCTKYNISQSKYYHPTPMRDEDQAATNTLRISLPDVASQFCTDDELMALCDLAVGSVGCVVRLTRASTHDPCWFVEFSSVDAAITALKNIWSCPGMFLHIEFSRNSGGAFYHVEHQLTPGKSNTSGYFVSQDDFCSTNLENKSGNLYMGSFTNKSDNNIVELVSPRMKLEKPGMQIQNGHAFLSNWSGPSGAEVTETGLRKTDDFGSSMAADHSFVEGPSIPHGTEQIWQYKKPEIEPQLLPPYSLSCPPPVIHGGTMVAPQIQTSSFMHSIYLNPSSSWDGHTPNPPLPLNQISAGMMPKSNLHINACAPVPFIPSSVTPLAQLPGNPMQHFDQTVTAPSLLPSSPPLPPDMPPPMPPSPPPLPSSQPPLVPPPPSSPPPLPRNSAEPSNLQTGGPCLNHKWQGTLSKSGSHYCTVYASREDSEACKYLNGVFEPADWPSRLDVTKRTDFRHVKATFVSTPAQKRAVCRLLPSTTSDQKGFRDFMSYLKQRECAGVIKIPSAKSMWARLLFILPCSPDACSLLSIAPHPADSLIALILAKETNFELV